MKKPFLLLLQWIALLLAGTLSVSAQSLTSGDVAGTVTDPSGAVVPNAAVKLTSRDTAGTQSTTSNADGNYRFGLVKPGRYTVAVQSGGFQSAQRSIEVPVGQTVTSNFKLDIGESTQRVDITSDQAIINPDPSNNTTFTASQMDALPSAGGDITNIAFTAPGAVVNVTGGYGNFTVNGLPATSNLFTINGENNMDPYFNINNSGASNLTLGQNELQEATIVTNPYGGQYGQLSGAQVTYVTRSGTNEFHGNALYWWNGRVMNSNNFFNNAYGTERPFSNANQWAARFGGPIFKNRTFFFVDTEGLRFVLPNNFLVTVPTQPFANAVLANVAARQPAEAATYQKLFNLYATAPGVAGAQPLANSAACKALTLPGFNPATQSCAARVTTSATALASEWILAGRVDQKISDRNNAFFRYKLDRGTQPTTIDPINSNFNAISKQPSWDTQFQDNHVINANATNEFTAALSHYTALFSQDSQKAISTFPYQVITSGTVPFTGFNSLGSFPQGRNITQYQFIDNVSWNVGKHNIRFGGNFRRNDVSDHNFFYNQPAVYFGYVNAGLQNFANGLAYQYRRSLNFASDVPIALSGLGLYAHDDWKVTNNFKLTLALRAEHNGNPVCNFNCFANFTGPFNSLASVTNANPGSVPYSSDINANLGQAFQHTDIINWSPRIGFSWSPTQSRKTVISGGFGIFYDSVPAGLVDNLLANPPTSVSIRVRPSSGVAAFDPNGGAAIYAASASAFSLSKTYSQISSQLTTLGAVFAAPSFTGITGTLKSQQFREWNFQVQQQLSNSLLFTLNYAGNSGRNIPYANSWANGFDTYGLFPTVNAISPTARVRNYGTVTQIQSGAISNYHGVSATLSKRLTGWVTGHASYTYGHNLDEVSNGGIFTYGDSLLGQINPSSLRTANYGNSDYDIRHNFAADIVVMPKITGGGNWMRHAVNGWQLSSKIFWRSGLPFSITDGNVSGVITNSTTTLLAYPNGGKVNTADCGHNAIDTPCLNAGAFIDSGADSFTNFPGFSPQTRNQFRGPHFFNTDAALFRNFAIRERVSLGIGIQAFNVFNHPNFAAPDSSLGSSTFGNITGTVGSPTSAYGTFLGFDSSVRVVQLSGKFTF